jgi:hypothetical protein
MNNIHTLHKGIRRHGNVGEIEEEEINSSNHKTSHNGTIS